MTGERPDGFMLIGLHKLAAQNGDGLIPELVALLTRESRLQEENPNVTAFPIWETRQPARDIPFVDPGGARPETTADVIAFPWRAEGVERRKGSCESRRPGG
ncbi:hypothetical protein IB238_11785 [Rhizobium sp. ARZ01]|uniref:hypothetical protein n=1 Tax=Rhizobium sp. ARZ01 TaxID=2769313 RepID=UPI0017846B84|nr:hypothetical protein [Rhizobium sp. ARZ01]MBD9373299.1 hypothetical protein [Rhizobium sp. ARZ01]